MSDLVYAAAAEERCKCCGGPSAIFCVVDLHDNIEPIHPGLTGVPIYYHRCKTCGFLFTTAFDTFSGHDFGKWIYNADINWVNSKRQALDAECFADSVAINLPEAKSRRIVTFGGDGGMLAEMLGRKGFTAVDARNPFAPAVRSTEPYELVLCFEAVEGATEPSTIFRLVERLIAARGLALVFTHLVPDAIELLGPRWPYITPRAGRVSLFTANAMRSAIKPLGLNFSIGSDCINGLWKKELPDFAKGAIVANAKE